MIVDAIVAVVLLCGAGFAAVAGIGLVRLSDLYMRTHAATKAGTLALALICVGALVLEPSVSWAWRLALVLGFLIVTLPVASHLLARAAVEEAGLDDQIRDAPLVGDDPR